MKDLIIANLKRILEILEHEDEEIVGAIVYDSDSNRYYSSNYKFRSELKGKMKELRRDTLAYEKLLYDMHYISKIENSFKAKKRLSINKQ